MILLYNIIYVFNTTSGGKGSIVPIEISIPVVFHYLEKKIKLIWFHLPIN